MPIKPTSVSKSVVQKSMKAFEKALKSATNADGSVDIEALKAEAKKVAKDADLHAVFDKSIDVLEKSFAHRRTVQGSCGSSIVKEAPATLSAKQVKSVFAALIEAKGKGLDKIDKEPDATITPEEAKAAHGSRLSDKLARAAARGVTHERESRPRRPSSGGTIGC